MRRFLSLLLAAGCVLSFAAHGQVTTNLPATKIENFELQTDTVIVKGFNEVGTINTSSGVVSVRCKQSAVAATGLVEYGIAVGLSSNDVHGSLVVDYDELDALLNGLTFLSRVTYNVTPMPSFDASITTRSGLRIAAHSERRQAAIQLSLQFEDSPVIPMSPDQFSQFQNLVLQAKQTIDGIKNKNSSP
jgi:hypothetical protein